MCRAWAGSASRCWRRLARDREIRRSYPDGIFWVSVGQQPNLAQLQRDSPGTWAARNSSTTDTRKGKGVLRQLLLDKAVLLVLDDVWKARDAMAFDVLGPRCRVLVTTRDAGVLHTLHGELVPVSLFTKGEALQLLADAVGVQSASLPPEAREVVRECGCLPLAVAVWRRHGRRGGPVGRHPSAFRGADLEKIADRQAINPQHESIWRAMQASVDVLPRNNAASPNWPSSSRARPCRKPPWARSGRTPAASTNWTPTTC